MAVDDVFKVTISSTGQGSVYQNTYHVRMKTEPPATEALFATFVTDAIAMVRSYQVSTISYTQWEAVQQWGAGMVLGPETCQRSGGLAFGAGLSGLPGISISEGLPPQAALVLTWITGFAGRRRRGRTYVGGQPETVQNDGLWMSTHITDMTTKLNAFLAIYKVTTGTSPNLTLGIWSERTASGCVPGPRPPGGHVSVDTPHPELAFTPISSGVVRPTVYSQRRRTRGAGR
jgi:hypothetical protein